METRGRPSLKSTDYSNINYNKATKQDKEKLLLNLLSKAPRGMGVIELSKKSMPDKVAVKKVLISLIKQGSVFGPYEIIYFHKKYMRYKKNGKI